MNTKPNHTVCHNPACHKPIARGEALLRSVSLEQVAFCSKGCVEMFDELDGEHGHHRIPAQRQPVGQGGRMSA